MEVNPLNIFFVKSDSKGDRLLFRYPYVTESKDDPQQKNCGRQNPYAISCTEDLLQNPPTQTSNISQGQLSGFTDEMLSTLFAVKSDLCNRKFELKVNDVRFVGHPSLLPYRTNKEETSAMIVTNIVFALQASASHSIVKCYYDLSKRLGKALRLEELRCSYLTEEMKTMLSAHDEVSSLGNEGSPVNDEDEEACRLALSAALASTERPTCAFHLILQRSSLARSMKQVFEELSSTGIVQVHINKWVLLSFCLPHKAHQIHNKGLVIEPETIDKCLQKLRPYHGILLMVNPNDLLASIPLDGSAALLQLIKLYSPLKSLQTLAIEADLSLQEVFQLTGHLVYWAKATVIYPLCESNVYVVAPSAALHAASPLVHQFAKEFPGMCLLQTLGEFSLPAPLWYVGRRGAGPVARAVSWLLCRRLLLQLHTYLQFNAHAAHPAATEPGECLARCGRHECLTGGGATVAAGGSPCVADTPATRGAASVDSGYHNMPDCIEFEPAMGPEPRDTSSDEEHHEHRGCDGLDELDAAHSHYYTDMRWDDSEECDAPCVSLAQCSAAFTEAEWSALGSLPRLYPRDTALLARLHRRGYFRGEQHLEEIMFMENVTRSQLMQLLDKFKDVLITFETEDPAVAMLYPYQ